MTETRTICSSWHFFTDGYRQRAILFNGEWFPQRTAVHCWTNNKKEDMVGEMMTIALMIMMVIKRKRRGAI